MRRRSPFALPPSCVSAAGTFVAVAVFVASAVGCLGVVGCSAGPSLEELNDILSMPSSSASAPVALASSLAAPPASMTAAAAGITDAPQSPTATLSGVQAGTGPSVTGTTPSTASSLAQPDATASAEGTEAVPSMNLPPAPSVTQPAASGSEVVPPVGAAPYAPRTGPFTMLIYPIAKVYIHGSIGAGVKMLQSIGVEQGFQTVVASDNSDITPEGLAKYEIVFFMNTNADIFNETEQRTFEDWMTTKNGAFGGTHSATDTENGWAFYSEVTGQYYDSHDDCCAMAQVQWQPAALNHVTVRGLPSPWNRSDEWYRFNRAAQWSTKAGFTVLSTVTTAGGGTRPVSFVREYGNFRSFYTSLGHQAATFEDEDVRKHIARGIMWAVRREARIVGFE